MAKKIEWIKSVIGGRLNHQYVPLGRTNTQTQIHVPPPKVAERTQRRNERRKERKKRTERKEKKEKQQKQHFVAKFGFFSLLLV